MNETMDDYKVELLKLVKYCNYEETLDMMLWNIIICGDIEKIVV